MARAFLNVSQSGREQKAYARAQSEISTIVMNAPSKKGDHLHTRCADFFIHFFTVCAAGKQMRNRNCLSSRSAPVVRQ